jgi:4-oxalocrotonate tautomerase
MPIVRIELFSGRTREQKADTARGIADVLKRTMAVPPENTQVIFVDVEKSDWARGGELYDKN